VEVPLQLVHLSITKTGQDDLLPARPQQELNLIVGEHFEIP